MTSGYRDPLYAAAFAMWGDAVALPASGAHLLLRTIPGADGVDAQGCYPVCACARPSHLVADLEACIARTSQSIVTLSLVPDPLRDWPLDQLQAFFPIRRPLGPHVVVEPGRWTTTVSAHHRRAIARAGRHSLDLGIEANVPAFMPTWRALYATLVRRAGITGLRTFSPAIFDAMARVPGSTIVSARLGGTVVGADWYLQDGHLVYAHLSAYAEEGYAVGASYPLMAAALDHFAAAGVERLDLGGVPLHGATDGLAAFKAGWSPLRRPSLFLGRVIDDGRYSALAGRVEHAEGTFFPAYRRGEY